MKFAIKDELPPPPPSSSGTKISPAVLFIALILAVLFFITAFLHLLVRFLTKPPNPTSEEDEFPEISRQLQNLFNLHDSGLDQAFIDALPVFIYEEIVRPNPNEPFDCAVCLCEFCDKDKLRLLPTCSHAFHIGCIDTWLLSNSTCPLCRAALSQFENPVFESEDEDEKMAEIRLGKFRKLSVADEFEGCDSSSALDVRRCYSMGSYQYVVGDASLRVVLCSDKNPIKSKINEFEFEGKKISSVSRGDSYSVSKIWLWQKKGGLPSSSGETRIDLSSLGTSKFP